MSKLPWVKFFVGDWLKDHQLRMASMSSKGIWIDLLCAMFEAEDRGVLEATADQFCKLLGCPHEEFNLFLSEAKSLNFANVREMSADCPQTIRIESRRMLRDEKQRQAWGKQKRQQRHPEPTEQPAADCPPNVRDVSGRCPPVESEVRDQKSDPEKNKSADAPSLFQGTQEGRSKPQKKTDPYEHWFTTSLLPAFPIEGHTQQKSALSFLRKGKPSPAELDAYIEQIGPWKPIWTESGHFPGLCTFLTDGAYRQAPARRSDQRNGKAPAAPLPTADDYYGSNRA